MKSIKFKGKEYSRTKIVNSILRFYDQSTNAERINGMNWYKEANELAQELATKTGYSVMNICGVISALSPQTSWELNKVYLVRFMKEGMKAKANTTDNKRKALACLSAKTSDEIATILNGNKTVNFFLNIAFPDVDSIATIDRHAVAICIQRPDNTSALDAVQMTDNQYKFIEDCYTLASNKVGIKALELQAVTWITYRRLRGLK